MDVENNPHMKGFIFGWAEPTFYLEEGYVSATHQHKAPCSNSWRNRCIKEAPVIKLPTDTVERTASIYQQIRRTSPMLPINQGVRMMFQHFSVSLSLSLVQLEKIRCNQKTGNTIITFCSKKRCTPNKNIQHYHPLIPSQLLLPKKKSSPPPKKKGSPEIWASWMTWRSLPFFYSTPQLAHEDFDSQFRSQKRRRNRVQRWDLKARMAWDPTDVP